MLTSPATSPGASPTTWPLTAPMPAVQRPAVPGARPVAQMRTFLPEVQALRAVAVMLVVVYHLWPTRLHGGFVGVDVFFVISGFLITSHLHREVTRTGTVSLRGFYARRARRLLPAAMLVLLVSAAATTLFLPATRWADSARDLLASVFYVQNWSLAGRAVDYSALGEAASAVQHYWSLSVEEQFYLAWPPLVLLLTVVGARLRARHDLVLPGIVLVTLASFGWSVYATAHDPAAAYFVTPTRVWELGVGALLALWTARRATSGGHLHRRPNPAGPVLLRWAGLAAIAVAALTFSGATAFPGWIALVPVLGAAAVIAAGDTGRRDPLTPVAGARPVQFLGAVSYSLYLWHWPFIVVAPFVLDRPLSTVDKVALLLACIGLAWLTKVLVEDRTLRWQLPVARPFVAALATAAAMLVVAGAAGGQLLQVHQQEDEARARLAASQDDPCFGAAAMAPDAAGCGDVFGPPVSATLAAGDAPWFPEEACTAADSTIAVSVCRFGTEPPTRRVALVGDSHAEHWRGALHGIAREMNWEIVEILKGGCPMTSAPVLTFGGAPSDTATCRSWAGEAAERLAAEDVDYVFTSSFGSAYGFEGAAQGGVEGFTDTWSTWTDAGAQVFVLRDVPTTGGVWMNECVATSPDDPLVCARPRAEAVVPDPMIAAAEQLQSDRVQLVDLTEHFCDDVTCYAVVGGAHVYWDRDHMSSSFSRSLAPYLLQAIGGGLA